LYALIAIGIIFAISACIYNGAGAADVAVR